MKLKEMIKKNRVISGGYRVLNRKAYDWATMISPTLNTKMRYYSCFHKKLNLKNPTTFTEKLLWLKLNCYIKSDLVAKCADKYLVREYIQQCGCEDILNDLIGVYDSPDEIDWDKLPDRFVLKWNFGAGMNIICSDKSKMDRNSVVEQLREWGKVKYWLPYSEMQYRHTKKKIICEKFLEDENEDVIPDYKVYCFHGEPLAIFVMHDRGKGLKTEFFDPEWNPLNNTGKYNRPESMTPRPKCLSEMMDVSRKLSKPFPFVRCDFYVVNDKVYFGELTFTPAGALKPSQTLINGKDMANYLHLDKKFEIK